MSVAEKTVPETTQRSPHQQLAWSSLLGALYVLFGLGMIFSGLPWLWGRLGIQNEFLSSALLLIVEIGAMVGFVFLGLALETKNPPHGLRAGVFFASVAIVAAVWIAQLAGLLLANAEFEAGAGIAVMVAVAVGLLYLASRIFVRPDFTAWLGHVEDQGWFHAVPYKGNQGVRVRRGTILALLVLGFCGIITLISHGALGDTRIGRNDWLAAVPFTAIEVPVMYQVHFTIPLVLSALLVWISWRLVNWPTFADFLIATEAEMNKVSWTTRKRLFQDTIVVLVTVVLLTVFLFVIDILWIKILSAVEVLRVDVRAEQLKQQEKTQW